MPIPLNSVSSTASVKNALENDLSELGSYRKVGVKHGINHRVVTDWLKRGIEPKCNKTRVILGLPPTNTAYVIIVSGNLPPDCMVIGEYRTCTKRTKCAGQKFVPNHPGRRACYTCNPVRHREDVNHA